MARRHIAVCLLPVLLLVTVCAPEAVARVIYVNAAASGLDDGSSWENAYVDLQDALGTAVVGDEIWVAAASYLPTQDADPTVSFELVNGVALYGGFVGTETERSQRDWVTHETVLSGLISGPDTHPRSSTVLVCTGADETTVLDGFTIRGGFNFAAPLLDGGGGMRNVAGHPTLQNLLFMENHSTEGGGGMLNASGSPTITNAVFRNNSSRSGYPNGGGGGLLNVDASPTLIDVVFDGNEGHLGVAGMANTEGSAPTIVDGAFLFNRGCANSAAMLNDSTSTAYLRDVVFFRNWTQHGAGGIHHKSDRNLELTNVVFEINGAGYGGTGGLIANHATLIDCRFAGNYTESSHAGMSGSNNVLINVVFTDNSSCCYPDATGSGGFAGSGTLINVLFANNTGTNSRRLPLGYEGTDAGGASVHGNSTLVNVTFMGNSFGGRGSGGLHCADGQPTVVNAVVWGNVLHPAPGYPGSDQIYVSSGSPLIAHSLVQGSGGSGPNWDTSLGIDGGGNIDADPRFVDPVAGDAHLRPASPAIDTGDSGALAVDITADLDGNPRISGGSVDMGAYEFACLDFEVVFGDSWDGVSLQEVLDAEYGAGSIDAATDYEGHSCRDAARPYWFDLGLDGVLVRQIAGNAVTNVFGWHIEDFDKPMIDGRDDGVIFDGSELPGTTRTITLGGWPPPPRRFGFYLNPAGPGDTPNAPEPEHFFVNRHYNDEGPDGSGDAREPEGGDPQCLIYNVTHLRGGVPTFVLAWEDFDYGGPITPQYQPGATDNDFQDLVVEIRAMSPMPVVSATLDAVKTPRGIQLWWRLQGAEHLTALQLVRYGEQAPEIVLETWTGKILPAGTYLDAPAAGTWRYRLVGTVEGEQIASPDIELDWDATPSGRVELLGASPNPFNPSTTLSFNLPQAMHARLEVFDVAGRLVTTLVDEERSSGLNAVRWNGDDARGTQVGSGSYFCRLSAGGRVQTQRVVLLK